MLANLVGFLGMGFWGWTADIIGRRWAMIIPATIAISSRRCTCSARTVWITVGFVLQGAFGGAIYSQLPSYLSERFPTEVRATASASAITRARSSAGWSRRCWPICAINYNLGYAVPMLVGTIVAAVSVVIALLLSPETKGKVLMADLFVA